MSDTVASGAPEGAGRPVAAPPEAAVSPVLRRILDGSYGTINEFQQRARRPVEELVDLGVGDPRAETPELIREALRAGVPEVSVYPTALGTPEARAAVAAWVRRRFGVAVDPETEVLPTNGSKEALSSLALALGGGEAGRNVTLVTEPGYTAAARGAALAGSEVVVLPLRAELGFLPDLAAVPERVLDRTAVLHVNYPNNPTGVRAPPAFYEEATELAGRHGFLLASDEAYSEVYRGDPPASALQVPDRSRVLVFNSLSKRSGLTAYRSGCIVGPPGVMQLLRRFRGTMGVTPPPFVQCAAVAAWGDEEHVEALRSSLMRRVQMFVDVFVRSGVRFFGGEATPYLWVATPPGETSEGFAEALLESGVVVTPGNWFGVAGEGYVRVAAMAPEAECRRACEILEGALG